MIVVVLAVDQVVQLGDVAGRIDYAGDVEEASDAVGFFANKEAVGAGRRVSWERKRGVLMQLRGQPNLLPRLEIVQMLLGEADGLSAREVQVVPPEQLGHLASQAVGAGPVDDEAADRGNVWHRGAHVDVDVDVVDDASLHMGETSWGVLERSADVIALARVFGEKVES